MNSFEASSANSPQGVAELLQQAGLDSAGHRLTLLAGGKNNQVYRVDFENSPPLVLKRYFFSPADRRDRFHSEKCFYELIKAAGLTRQTPQALAWDNQQRLGLFSWIEGRRIRAAEVTRMDIEQALSFYFDLNAHHDLQEASAVPDASEACFSLEEHFNTVQRRLIRCEAIDKDSPLGGDALDFVNGRLRPAFDAHKMIYVESKLGRGALEKAQRCLSPSDFGFHNSLVQNDGTIVFFDFEYAGWDDPAKFISDLLCQPEVPVPEPLWSCCIDSLCQPIKGGSERERISLLLPLYHLKWCCILLNEFLPQEQNRRAFSQQLSPSDVELKRHDQLDKARILLEKFITLDLRNTSR